MNENANITSKTVGNLPQNKGSGFYNKEQNATNNEPGFGFSERVSMLRAEILLGILGAFIAGLFIGACLVAAFFRLHTGN